MATMKTEILYVEAVDDSFAPLYSFSGDSSGGAMPTFVMPVIGQRIVIEFPGHEFAGTVQTITTMHSNKDIKGDTWDFVTKIIVVVDVDGREVH